MKTAALSLALAIAAVQTVGWVECCCVLICKHQNDPCKDCAEKPEAAAEACCDPSHEPAKEEAPCTHVQPSSEVASHATPLPPVILDVVLELPVVPPVPGPTSIEKTDRSISQARGSPPLHLLHSVFLI